MKHKITRSFTTNILIVFTAQIIVKILGMLYRMVITNIDGFGDVGNGFYSAGFQIYTLLLAVSSIGIPNAVSKLVSEKVALSDFEESNKIFKTSMLVFAVIGTLLSVLLFIFSKPIAKYILNMEGTAYTMAALAPSIFFVCISSVFRGYFSGINKMNAMSFSQVIEQLFKSILTVIFVLLAIGKTPEIMSGWANFATTLATMLSTAYLFYMYKVGKYGNNFKGKRIIDSDFFRMVKTILMIAVPISLCSVISAVNRIVDTATITRGIEKAFSICIPARDGFHAIYNPTVTQLNDEAVRLAGMLSKSDTLINLPLALNIAFATVLVPAISRCRAIGNKSKIREYINLSLLMSVVLVLPCAVGYIVLAKPIYNLIYPNASLGYELLQLSAVSLIFTALTQTITGALQGLGKAHIPTVALAAGCGIKVALNYILISIPQINIYGAVIGSIACQFVVLIIEWITLSKTMDGGLSAKAILFKPLICNALMCAATYYAYRIVRSGICSSTISLIITIAASAILYGMLVILLKVVTPKQLAKIPILSKTDSFFKKKHIRNK